MHVPRLALSTARTAAAHAPLRLGAAASPLEREADRAAAQVLGRSTHGRPLLRAVAPTAQGPVAPPIVAQVLATPGQALDTATRNFFEPRFGHDFGRVRVHADAQAARSARAVRAHAYAAGSHIVLGAGAPAPHSAAGRHLLAHELGHVVQHGQGAPALVQRYGFDEDKPCIGNTRQIEEGHRLARAAVGAAQQLLAQGPPGEGLGQWFRYLFGARAEPERSTIASNFGKLHDALGQDYIYECPPVGEHPCNGAQAEVLTSGQVAICGEQIQGFSRMGMARLLIHENVRRAQGRRHVTNINDPINGECRMSQNGTQYVEATTDANHPIPYSCFAEQVLTRQRAQKQQEVLGLLNLLFDPLRGPSFWQGDMGITPGNATVPAQVPVRAQLHLQMVDTGFVVFGSYQYRHPGRGPVEGEIVFGTVDIQDRTEGERMTIRFDWREGHATGRGYWLSEGAHQLKGKWGRALSMTDGGDWSLKPQP